MLGALQPSGAPCQAGDECGLRALRVFSEVEELSGAKRFDLDFGRGSRSVDLKEK